MIKKLLVTLNDGPNKSGGKDTEPESKVSTSSKSDDETDGSDSSRFNKEKFIAALFLFSQWVQVKAQPLVTKLDWSFFRVVAAVLALSFVLASSVNTLAANSALNFAISKKVGASDSAVTFSAPSAPKNDVSPTELRRGILERNIFNAQGTLAPEESDVKVTRTNDLDFSSVQCTSEPMPIEIVGTIFTGDPTKSFVSVKDPKIEESDIYKSGDLVIDHEEYEVYRVYRGRVEFRKGDLKICVTGKGFDENEAEAAASAANASIVSPENVETVEFDYNYLVNEIGPGYANILNSAKLIPELEEGKMMGFKLLSIVPGSLFDRMKLQNADVITEVNGTSMRDPSQGFKLYQALQEEREITVRVMRNGQSMIRKVRVK